MEAVPRNVPEPGGDGVGPGDGAGAAAEDAVAVRLREVAAGIARGWAFTPLHGKVPTLRGWQRRLSPTLEEVLDWAREGNVGLRTGRISEVVVVDIDPGADTAGLELPPTVTVETGRGGRHLYYRAPDTEIPNSAGRLGEHIDVRGEGGQVVYPGSVHPNTGRAYRWAPGASPDERDIAPLPAWIREALARNRAPAAPAVDGRGTGYGLAALQDELCVLRGAAKGTRNDQLNRSAFVLAQLVAGGQLDAVATRAALEGAAAPWVGDEFTLDELHRALDSGWRSGTAKPRGPASPSGNGSRAPASGEPAPYHTTDVGNGARLVARHGEDLRYCYPWKAWFVWDGARWIEDKSGAVMRLAKDTVAAIYVEAARAGSEEQRKSLASWACRSESVERLRALVEAAHSEPGVAVLPEHFDRDPWLLNAQNGTIDLRGGTLRAHSRQDLITRVLPVAYDASAECPRFLAFLDQIMAHNEALVGYLQRVVGYWLTGQTSEQCFWILHGTGANGKSVLVNTVRALLADYAEQTPTTTFMVQRNGQSSNDLAQLCGARFVSAIESEEGYRLAEGLVKQLTGQDPVTARFLYREYFTFRPAFKVAMATNHRPVIRGTDHAMWRRVRLVPFNVTIPEDQQDRDLAEKLHEELPGILAWAVVGCQQWLEDGGLRDPPEVLAATADYRAEQDRLGEFIAERCVEGAGQAGAASDLYSAYKQWCEGNGEKPASQRWFGQRLKDRGHRNDRRLASGRKVWQGIGLRLPIGSEP